MCGGGGSDNSSKQAAAADAKRQANITSGIANIDKAFNGYDTTTGVNAVDPSAYIDGTTYYTANGTPYVYRAPATVAATKPTVESGWAGAAQAANPDAVKTTVAPAAALPSQLFAGTQTSHTGGFDDSFYNGIAQDYTNYAEPQLDDQYQQAVKDLTFQLARQGISSSSAAGDEQARLEKQYNQYRTDVASQAQAAADKSRSDLQNTRTTLINQLTATNDPVAAGASAVQAAALQSKPPTFDPLGTFTFDLSSGLKQDSAVNNYAPLAPSLFTSSPYGASSGSSVKYINT